MCHPNNPALPFNLCRLQFPVRVAYAMTINKSQGEHIENRWMDSTLIILDVFGHGQLYVALSRVGSPSHIPVFIPPSLHGSRQNYTHNVVYTEVLTYTSMSHI